MSEREPLGVASISGGKDSQATATIAGDVMGRERVRYTFSDTGNEHELTYEFVYDYLPSILGPIETVRADFSQQIANKRIYVATVWPTKGVPTEIVERALSVLHPTGVPFLDLCLWKGRFPSRKVQFCTQELKRFPLDKYLLDRMSEGYDVSSWRGIRRDESQTRKDAIEHEMTAEGYSIEQPIVSWSAERVVAFLRARGQRLNPLYSLGMGRVGCMPCINCAKDELLAIAKRFPKHIDKIREWEALVCLAAKRGWTTFFTDKAQVGETDAETFARLCIDERVRWAETAHGGRQSDFIRQGQQFGCSSMYGLCE